ncbi:hypothetical protein SAMN05444515_12325 [Ectothiorhodospira marina]|uniref:Tetratricopeptide repeat-containing protein n=2 Tax=Ectothiorhodospira marina TaxID=1396821 RepID=A0A1H7RIW3_9GAMM|nr:hypothetical protein SAMN05444515_12325 [Ectothiorhodospira marina]
MMLLFVVFLAFISYATGLSGPFLFDDIPSIKPLGALGPIQNMELFWAYVLDGFAGPTGRPIALASFLLDARDWPADPYSFKRTNLILHLVNGLILFAIIRTLLQSIGHDTRSSGWIALMAMALWLLNPFLVSTTLYVVQRMTQLAALFVLLGIWGYLKGRLILPTRPRLGYLLITLSVVAGTILATYSKENGALLPLLILSIEFALAHHWIRPSPDWRWMALYLWLPAFAIVFYLISKIPASGEFLHRDFNLMERLWTQPRFIFDYLWHLFVPHIQTQGLYHDGRVISTSWLTPWTTLPAALGLAGLVITGFWARYRWPLLSLAILFFLGGHLIESTTIGLELYFEHRNYLPAVFLFLPIAAGIWFLRTRLTSWVVLFMALSLIGSYGLATWQRAVLWGNEDQLMLTWGETNPESPRAQTVAAQTWIRMGYPDRAFSVLESAIQRMPDSGLLITNLLTLKMDQGRVTPQELEETLNKLLAKEFDAQMIKGLEHIVDTINRSAPMPEYKAIMYDGLTNIREHLQGRVSVVQRYTFYLQGKLLSEHDEPERAYTHFSQALDYYKSTETGLNMVSRLAMDGHFAYALKLLEKTRGILKTEPDDQLKRRRDTYETEIERLRKNLVEDMAIDSQNHNQAPNHLTMRHPIYRIFTTLPTSKSA